MRVKGSGKSTKKQHEKFQQMLEAKNAKIKQLQSIAAKAQVSIAAETLKAADAFYTKAQANPKKTIIETLLKLNDEQLKTIKDMFCFF